MILAVDTGGTKTLVAAMSETGVIKKSLRFPTPATTDEYVRILRETVETQFANAKPSAVVVALPGIVRNGIAVWCNNLGWRNFDAERALDGLGGKDVPIFIENDANLAGLGEARHLSPIPPAVLYVTISTGIGTGIITDGHIDPALRYSEGGRSLVEFDGRVLEWESFASGRAIHKTYGKFAREITAKRTWSQIADRISRGFLATIPILQPDTIIVGGSVGTYFGRFAPQLETILIEKLPPHIPCPQILQAAHPEEAVLFGCYYYAKDCLA